MCIISLLVQQITVVWNGRIIPHDPLASANLPEDTRIVELVMAILTHFEQERKSYLNKLANYL